MNPRLPSRLPEHSRESFTSSPNAVTSSLLNTHEGISGHEKFRLPMAPLLPKLGPAKRTKSIPITNHSFRKSSSSLQQQQSSEDQDMADYRDFIVFSRIVDGISRQQEDIKDFWLRRENDLCLAHIIRTRNGMADHFQDVSYTTVDPYAYTRGSINEDKLDKILDETIEETNDEIFIMDM
jgi:hypothetical protein